MKISLRITRGIYVVAATIMLACAVIAMAMLTNRNEAFAEVASANRAPARVASLDTDRDFVVTDTANEVEAIFEFASIGETECSVKLTNKTTATTAVVPSTAVIDGKEYTVTEVSANGFTSASKLVRVHLPKSINKIGNTAFANCSKLQRISLANIKTIGNNAFYRCPSLTDLVLPRSIENIGSYILRNNDTQVHVRGNADGAAWSTNWNSGNANQDIEYNSTYKEPLELETVYENIAAYSADSDETEVLTGYIVAAGQPCIDEFYDGVNYFIPEKYNDLYITAIKSAAFDGATFGQFIVEYSDMPLKIGSHVFDFTDGDSIIINRDAVFFDYDTDTPAESVFFCSGVKTVVLPDSITELAEFMFSGCADLTNIFFRTPEYTSSRDDMLAIAPTLTAAYPAGIVYLPNSAEFTVIREGAFDGTTAITELHIYDTVESVRQYVLSGWENSQKAIVHNDNGKLPEYDFETKTGWHPQWCSNAIVEYTRNFYDINFDANGGTVTVSSKEVEKGVAVGELPVPENGYWAFDGWIDDQGLKYDENTVYERDDDCTLSALWIAPEYYIAYDKNTPVDARSEVEGEMETSTHFYNSISSLNPNMYYLYGWDFLGWNTSPDGSGTSFTDGQDVYELCSVHHATVTLYAQWQLHNYTITYIINDDDVYNPNTIETYTVNDDTIVFEAPVKEGFACWWDPPMIESGSIGDFETTAYISRIRVHIKYDANGGENSTENLDEVSYGDNVIFKNPTGKPGYTFVGWRISGTDNIVRAIYNIKESVTLIAVWVETGTLYAVPNTVGECTVSADTATVFLMPRNNNGLTVTVKSTVKRLYVYSDDFVPVYANIIAEDRNTALTLILDNIKLFSRNADTPTVSVNSAVNLNLMMYRGCIIYGAAGAMGSRGSSGGSTGYGDTGGVGGQGGIAVKCHTLVICSSGEIRGGVGGQGGRGGSGGKIAGRGGRGGQGNYAVDAVCIVIQANNVNIVGGRGGQGGTGGVNNDGVGMKGGAGGDGGEAVNCFISGADDYINVNVLKGESGAPGKTGDLTSIIGEYDR